VPDVLRRGRTTWARGIGVRCCLALCRYLKKSGFHLVVDPFCGEGLVLAVANHYCMNAVGVELSRKRAETARRLDASPLLAEDAAEEAAAAGTKGDSSCSQSRTKVLAPVGKHKMKAPRVGASIP